VCERESEAHQPGLDRRGDAGVERQGTGRSPEETPARNQSDVHVGLHRRCHRASWGSGKDAEFIQKPFSPDQLAIKSGKCCCGGRASGCGGPEIGTVSSKQLEAPRFMHKFCHMPAR